MIHFSVAISYLYYTSDITVFITLSVFVNFNKHSLNEEQNRTIRSLNQVNVMPISLPAPKVEGTRAEAPPVVGMLPVEMSLVEALPVKTSLVAVIEPAEVARA